jgi:hypothetical protein
MTPSTHNLKGKVKIIVGDFAVDKGEVVITQGDLAVTAGKIYVGGAEVVTVGLIPDAQGNVTLTGNLSLSATKMLNLSSVAVGVANNHLSIGGVEIWATS